MTRAEAAVRLFALDASRAIGEKVARRLGVPLAGHAEEEFDDGEFKCRPLDAVRGSDAFVVHSLSRDHAGSQSDKLMRLLVMVGALADAGAASVTAVVPYLCYARQDRQVQPGDPVVTRYVARMFEAAGASRVLAMDVHNLTAFQNAFRLPTGHVETTRLFCGHFAAVLDGAEAVVVSPDAGGAGRAERLRRALSEALDRPVAGAFVEKQRGGGTLRGEAAFGQFADRIAIILDDMICTGATIARAARVCRELGARRVLAAATHGIFAAEAARALADAALDAVVVTDSIPARQGPDPPNLTVLDAAQPIADAIREIIAARGC